MGTDIISVGICDDRESIPLVTEVFDLLTSEQIPEARVYITFIPEGDDDHETEGHEDHVLARDVTLNANGQLSLQIRENGTYTARVSAPGYKAKEKSVTVECDPANCDECTPKILVALEQEVCENTFMSIVVNDVATQAAVEGASVKVSMRTGATTQVVFATHMVCQADRTARTDCGYPGISEQECIQNCCFDDSVPNTIWCFHKTPLDDMTTNEEGIVSVPVAARGEFEVEITKEGYYDYTGDNVVSCTGPCDECRPRLSVSLTQEPPCNGTMDMVITVLDNKGNPVEDADVSLILSSSMAGASAADVGGSLTTSSDGTVSPLLFESGTYMVTVVAPGFLTQSVEKHVEIATDVCEDLHIPLTITLVNNPVTTDRPGCEDLALTITVKDLLTDVPLAGANLDITFEGSAIATNVLTDENGQLRIPVSDNGVYQVTATHSQYIASDNSKTLECTMANGCQCDTDLTVTLPVYVKDNLTNAWITGARVSLALTDSLSGPSLIQVGQPIYSNTEGLATFPIELNGEYSVSIVADGYISAEVPVTIQCNTAHCESCSPTAPIALIQDFCTDKELKLIVKDAQTNRPVVGATVSTTLEFYNGPRTFSTLITGETGEVQIPIVANGVYEAKVSIEGYIPFSTSYEVDVSDGECDILAPAILMTLVATPEDDCVSMSLIWGEEPQDLDLYSYRVHENNTNDQCLTYYCDGKDPCSGVTFDVDNQNGGNNGTETITYCAGSESYSNMVYVDDLSGEGQTLLASSARLIITTPEKTQEIVLNTTRTSDNENKRYWLAGCLVTDGAGEFDFLQLNQFLDVQPSSEDPLVCHSRIALSDVQDNYGSTINAAVEITVVDANTGEPVEGVLTSVTSERESHSRITGADGSDSLPVSQNGDYSLLAEHNDYISERHVVTVSCPENSEDQCITTMTISMLAKPTDGTVQFALNWGEPATQIIASHDIASRALTTISANQDLDLHILQVDIEDTRMYCDTYFANPTGCPDTSLNKNVQEGGSDREIITIDDTTTRTGGATYMVFADDNSVSGPALFYSAARIIVSDGLSTRTQDLPAPTEDAAAGSRYWLAGCLELTSNSFNYIPVNKFSRESPMTNEKYYCHNLFKNGGVVEPAEPFCPNTDLKVTIHNSLTNDNVDNSHVSIVLEDGGNEYVIANGAVPEAGVVSSRINKNGKYVIRVEADGFMSAREEYVVNCVMVDCGACEPTILVPVSPLLNDGEMRVVLSWGEKPRDLDIYAMRRNVAEWGTSCTTYHARRSGCEEATLDLDNTRGGNNGVETITMHDVPSHNGNVYMIFVQHYGYNRVTEEFGTSSAQIRITDGTKTTNVQLSPTSYGQEKHWLAGCIRMTGNTYQFTPINMFLNDRPDEALPDLCLDTFGLSTTTTTTPRPRTTTTRRPWWRRIFG